MLEPWSPSWRNCRTLKVKNLISADFQTQVSMWFLFSMKFCTRIINKKWGTSSQKHPTNLLAKQPKTTTTRLHAVYPMILNCQMYMTKLLKRFYLGSLNTSKVTEIDQFSAKFLRDGAEVLALQAFTVTTVT